MVPLMIYHVDSFAAKSRGGLLRMCRGLVRLERRGVNAVAVRIARVSGLCLVRLPARPRGEPVCVANAQDFECRAAARDPCFVRHVVCVPGGLDVFGECLGLGPAHALAASATMITTSRFSVVRPPPAGRRLAGHFCKTEIPGKNSGLSPDVHKATRGTP